MNIFDLSPNVAIFSILTISQYYLLYSVEKTLPPVFDTNFTYILRSFFLDGSQFPSEISNQLISLHQRLKGYETVMKYLRKMVNRRERNYKECRWGLYVLYFGLQSKYSRSLVRLWISQRPLNSFSDFCMKLEHHQGSKLTRLNFWKRILCIYSGAAHKKIS